MVSFFSSFLSTVHADAEEKSPVEEASVQEKEEEQPEPEDLQPVIREECKQSSKCAALTRHFEHCQEKVQAGEGYKGEDCVEEFMMHCVDNCAAPKLFAKLH